MKKKLIHILLMLLLFWALHGCNNRSAKPLDRRIDDSTIYLHDSTIISVPDTTQNDFFGEDDNTDNPSSDPLGENNDQYTAVPGMSVQHDKQDKLEQYKRVKNLLEFHTRDTMKQDSTYVATLAMGKKISPADLQALIKDILEPGGKVMVTDTTQEISVRMSAVLEDKASERDPNFLIRQIGGSSSIRTYDPQKNKMVWQWNVTPVKPGHHELILSISQVDDNGIVLGSPETRRHSIIIFAEPRNRGLGKSMGSFFSK